MGRAPCCNKVGLKRGRWTAEEDQILTKYVQNNGEGSWRSLPKNAGLLRCGKSCRLRWINYLRADLKRGNFSVEEEALIVKLRASVGNRWSLIASKLAGRTDNEIKNYWNSHLSRKIYSFRGLLQDTAPPPPPKRKGGRTSQWGMKKNQKIDNKSAAVTQHKFPLELTCEKERHQVEEEASGAVVEDNSIYESANNSSSDGSRGLQHSSSGFDLDDWDWDWDWETTLQLLNHKNMTTSWEQNDDLNLLNNWLWEDHDDNDDWEKEFLRFS